jgi:hypothetical protein
MNATTLSVCRIRLPYFGVLNFEFPRRALSWVMQFDASNVFQFQEQVRTLVSSADYFLGLETGDWRGKRADQIPANIWATSHSYSL